MLLDKVLGVEIPLFSELCDDELETRIEQEEAARLALDCFIQGKISLEDYMDILEMCEVEMDEFIQNTHSNLIIVGVF